MIRNFILCKGNSLLKANIIIALLFVCCLSLFIGSCQKDLNSPTDSKTIGQTSKVTSYNDKIVDGIYKYSSKPYGKSYDEWCIEWWKWVFLTEATTDGDGNPTHPVLDISGQYFMNGQSSTSDVIFLAGTFTGEATTRTITIGQDKALFFPLINGETDNMWNDPPKNVGQLKKSIKENDKQEILKLTIDDKEIGNLGKYYFTSSKFTYHIRSENSVYDYFGATGWDDKDIYPAISYGYWVMLAPLSSGSHTIYFYAGPSSGGHQEVTYYITVE